MNTLNIGGSNDDPFYRYKMPKVAITLQKKSGGTTVVNNTKAICDSLRREATHLSKYLSKSLKRPVQLKNNCWTMHGEVSADNIQTCVNDYIKAYVLCSKCGNPETIMDSGKLSCKSCGGETTIP